MVEKKMKEQQGIKPATTIESIATTTTYTEYMFGIVPRYSICLLNYNMSGKELLASSIPADHDKGDPCAPASTNQLVPRGHLNEEHTKS